MKFKFFKIIFFIYIFSFFRANNQNKFKNNINIAIIGSGSGGLSTAYFIVKNYFKNFHISNKYLLNLDIYEKDFNVGGRMKSINFNNSIVDMGASFFIKENKLLLEILKVTELKYTKAVEDEEKNLLILNNKFEKLLCLDNGFYYNLTKLVYKYKLGIFNANKIVDDLLKNIIDKIYNILDNQIYDNNYFSLQSLIKELNLKEMLSMSFYEYYKDKLNNLFLEEFIQSIIISCYSQKTKEVNAFTGSLILVTALKQAYKIYNGFGGLAKSLKNFLLNKSIDYFTSLYNLLSNVSNISYKNEIKNKININFINKKIINISKDITSNNNRKYYLNYNDLELNDKNKKTYDYVSVATGFNSSNIKFINFSNKNINNYITLPKYKGVNITEILVKGKLNYKAFNLNQDGKTLYSTILFNDILSSKFNNISDIIRVGKINNNDLYKIQLSGEHVNEDKIRQLFVDNNNFSILNKTNWKEPYPELKPIKKNLLDFNTTSIVDYEFIKNERIYFNNAFEILASCVELAIISGKNVANIILNEILKSSINNQKNDNNKTDL